MCRCLIFWQNFSRTAAPDTPKQVLGRRWHWGTLGTLPCPTSTEGLSRPSSVTPVSSTWRCCVCSAGSSSLVTSSRRWQQRGKGPGWRRNESIQHCCAGKPAGRRSLIQQIRVGIHTSARRCLAFPESSASPSPSFSHSCHGKCRVRAENHLK